jgi:hypothetical protein
VKGRGTNVFKLFEAADLNGHRTNAELTPQVALYDDGVGTESFKPLKVFAGATGFGLARNVRRLYKELVRIHDPGDEILLFGFSRGAFTVRTLAGLICTCGILNTDRLSTTSELEAAVHEAYKVYRKGYQTKLAQLFHRADDGSALRNFKRRYAREETVSIAFIGVWDTVDAVGTPVPISNFINTTIHRFKFPDVDLNPKVRFACQALSIDDQRAAFRPVLWKHDERINQVWFAGAHSNVGGGYPKQGMSLVALDWMLQQARDKACLRLLSSDLAFYGEHGNVDDKLYDPRAGLGLFYQWLPRDMSALCEERGVPPTLHLSVLERVAHGTDDYAPGTLAPNARVVFTRTGDPKCDSSAQARAKALEDVLRVAHADGKPLLACVGPELSAGRASYFIYVLSCPLILAGLLRAMWLLYRTGAQPRIITLLWPVLMGLFGLLAAYLMSLFVDHRMVARFSQFWHVQQPNLRKGLQRAREIARETGGS